MLKMPGGPRAAKATDSGAEDHVECDG